MILIKQNSKYLSFNILKYFKELGNKYKLM